MKTSYLVLSDVHSNTIALEAVLAHAEAEGTWDRLICAGDLVGYGWDPNGAVERLRDLDAAAVQGNHDWALTSDDDFVMNEEALRAAMENLKALTDENLAWLKGLGNRPLVLPDGTVAVVHGSFAYGDDRPEDPYVYTPRDSVEALRALLYPRDAAAGERCRNVLVGVVGHSHIQTCWAGWIGPNPTKPPETNCFWAFWIPGQEPEDEPTTVEFGLNSHPADAPERPALLLNPGSVGQPRDRDPRAAYCRLTIADDRVVADFRRVEYDVEAARKKLRDAGYPPYLVHRLRYGQ